MNAPIKDLTDYIVTKTSLVLGADLFAGSLPEASGTVVAFFDTGGSEPEPTDIQNPGIQIIGRADIGDYQAAYSLMSTVLGHLHKLANTTINGTKYIQCYKSTEILSLGQDETGRPVLSCNLRVKRS